jgi:hypothetical protein
VKNRLLKIILGCILTSFFLSCENRDERQLEKSCSTDSISVSPINPNGDSELALLMRQLFYDTDSLKQIVVVEGKEVPQDFINALEKVHTAIPTDPEVKTEEFTAYNELMINAAKELTSAKNKEEAYNNFLNRCIDCHQVVCPGPIKRIKKLIIH